MENFHGFLFDIDGTITSTNKLIFASFNYVAEKYLNKHLSDEEIIKLFGPTEDVILKDWMGENFEKAKKDYYNFYSKNHKKMAVIHDGITDILKIIKSHDIPLGIFTGKGKQTSIITLKAVGVYKYFDMIITGDDVKEHKPSPEGINKFLNKFSLNKKDVLLIGDSPSDVKAARKAGIKIASAMWDSYAKSKVLELKSDYYFYTTKELKKFIEDNLHSI